MMSDYVFVCYSRKDEDFVLKLAEHLKSMGVPIWIDQWNIPTGANWSRTIESALEECARLLIVLTPSSVESDEVQSEWLSALDRKKTIVPILHKDCQMPFRLKPIQYIDFTKRSPDDKEALEQIVRALGGHDSKSSSTLEKDKEVIFTQDAVAPDVKSQKNPTDSGHSSETKSAGGLPTNWIMMGVFIIGILLAAFLLNPTGTDIGTDSKSSSSDATPGQDGQTDNSISSERITFDTFPDGTPITSDTILRGDEFSAKGILLAGSPESSYCEDASSVAIHGPESMYNVDFNYLSSSDPQDINRCTGVPVAITFIEPVKLVTLTFAGASVPYTMKAYDSSNKLLSTATTENTLVRGGTFEITASTKNADIKLVTFGKETAGLSIKEIYYQR